MLFWIAPAAQVEVILSGSRKATAVEVSLDSPDGPFQHIAHLAGLEMSEACEDQLVSLLGPGPVQSDRVEMWV